MKKKIDERIRILIENCVKLNQRGLIIIVGDRGLYQVISSLILISIDCKLASYVSKGKNKGITHCPMVL
jgi:hypothetical protein